MSEAECELVNIAGIYENSMGQYIAAYEALDVLAPKWSLNSKTFYDHVVGENEPDDILKAKERYWRKGY